MNDYPADSAPSGTQVNKQHRRWIVRLSLAANLVLACILIAYLWIPDLNGRLLAFWHSSPEYHLKYQGQVQAQVTAQTGISDDTVVCLGDSIMASANLDLAVPRPYLNLGIGGDTLAGLLYRVPKFDQISHASAIVIHIGVNDLAHFDDSSIIRNYQELLNMLPENVPVLVHAILPINENLFAGANSSVFTGHRANNDRIQALNAQIESLVQERPRTVFCSSADQVRDATGNLQKELTKDGVHLNEQGKQIMASTIREGLARLTELDQ